METVNAKLRCTTIYWRVNNFFKESHIVTRNAEERASFLKIIDISFFGTPDGHHCCSIAYAGMLILWLHLNIILTQVCRCTGPSRASRWRCCDSRSGRRSYPRTAAAGTFPRTSARGTPARTGTTLKLHIILVLAIVE
jgi:hypothetical protein